MRTESGLMFKREKEILSSRLPRDLRFQNQGIRLRNLTQGAWSLNLEPLAKPDAWPMIAACLPHNPPRHSWVCFGDINSIIQCSLMKRPEGIVWLCIDARFFTSALTDSRDTRANSPSKLNGGHSLDSPAVPESRQSIYRRS
jgi:hypothetical protein